MTKNVLTTAELKEYLRIIVELEKNIYMQDKTIREMRYKAANLGKQKYIAEPQKRVLQMEEATPVQREEFSVSLLLFGIVAMAGGAWLALDTWSGMFEGNNLILRFFVGVVLLFIAAAMFFGGIAAIVSDFTNMGQAKRQNEDVRNAVEQRNQETRRRNREAQERYHQAYGNMRMIWPRIRNEYLRN